MTDLRYPVGGFTPPAEITAGTRRQWLDAVQEAPALLRAAVSGLSEAQLDTPYREGGWTVRQVVHHLVDSHLNTYVRYRLALTEEEPTIKPYDEAKWADLHDAKAAPVELSLALFESMHDRWVLLLKSMSEEDWNRTYLHPDSGRTTLERNLGLYAWHGRHHTAHITSLRERMGW